MAVLANTFINGLRLYVLGENWVDSLYAGTLLSQIGEFSLVLAAVGAYADIISDYSYQMTIAVISLFSAYQPRLDYAGQTALEKQKKSKLSIKIDI